MVHAHKPKEFSFDDHDFDFIVRKVYDHTGITLAPHKKDMVYGRLARRLRELQLSAFSQYCQLLESEQGNDELGKFVNAVTTNLTGFFRESHHFDHLKEALQSMVARPPKGKRIRIWSSACSSGQEPYSIAMTMREAISTIGQWDARILATDIDSNMVQTGHAGEYRKDLLDKIPSAYRRKYVEETKLSTTGTIKEDIKALIAFKQLNLLHQWPMKGPFDFIFCRNVVIYFDKPTQKTLFEKMANLLAPNGILYIGHSESLYGVSDRFKLIGRTIYQKES